MQNGIKRRPNSKVLQIFLIGQLPVVMPTVLKIRLYGFVRNVLIHHVPKYG